MSNPNQPAQTSFDTARVLEFLILKLEVTKVLIRLRMSKKTHFLT